MDSIVDWDRDTPQWSAVLAASAGCAVTFSHPGPLSDNALWPIYGPLVRPRDQEFVIGQLGQSLDGRIATASGHSHYINGDAALVHLHRLRALVDAVIVGVGTVIADDPQLTVRRAERHPGAGQPARVVIDPKGRLPGGAKCLTDDGARCIVIGAGAPPKAAHIEQIAVPLSAEGLAPGIILKELAARGLKRVLVEGGADTLSRFLRAGCLHRLHVMTAPLIIGSGPTGLNLPVIAHLDQALRPRTSTFVLPSGDVLFDCALND